jgi:hypothetical protein
LRPVDPEYTLGAGVVNTLTATAPPKARVEPIRVYYESNLLSVHARRGVGFHFVCDCGEVGARHKFRSEAVAGLKWHREQKHGSR